MSELPLDEITRIRDLTHRATSPFVVLYRDGDKERQAQVSCINMWMLLDAAERTLRLTEPAQAQVSDAEVEAACIAAYSACDMGSFPAMAVEPDSDRRIIRAALEAAASARLSAPLPDGRSCSLCNGTREIRKRESTPRIERLDAEMLNHTQDEVGALAISVEKLLCETLGRDWTPAGMSIQTLIADLHARLAACENLRAFAREALEDFWEGDGTMQDLGEKHHLLIPTIVNEACGEGCSCAEYGADFPTDCYRFAPVLAAQSSAKGVE